MAESTEKTRAELIWFERRRQIAEEGWTPAHDDAHEDGELVDAAVCYVHSDSHPASVAPCLWPWPDGWKPKDQISNLVRAGALIAAEIDRLQRAAGGDDG